MHRFFIPKEWIDGNQACIVGSTVHQIRNVLRLGVDDHITLLDNTGWQYEAAITNITKGDIEAKIENKSFSQSEPRTRITLHQAILKKAQFEFVLQKCTEMGIANFVPILSQRCVARWNLSKPERWQQIIKEAAEQSQRGVLPTLHKPVRFIDACKRAGANSFVAWEEERETSIRELLTKKLKSSHINKSAINIFIGPEGGFTPREIEKARDIGVTSFSLGKRVLRAETAGLVSASIILYELGDLGG
jgi:16S rRNA (uracil1498-N3)-methyltransferase